MPRLTLDLEALVVETFTAAEFDPMGAATVAHCSAIDACPTRPC